MAPADGPCVGARGAQSLVAYRQAERSRRTCRPVPSVEPGRTGNRLPNRNGLRLVRWLQDGAGAGHLGREVARHHLRVQSSRSGRQAFRCHRLRHDGEAGRVRPSPDANDSALLAHRGLPRCPGPLVRADRPQVVLLGAAVGRILHAGQGRRGGSLASSCRERFPTAATTGSSSSGSRTRQATSRTLPAKSSMPAHSPSASARKAVACGRSCRTPT